MPLSSFLAIEACSTRHILTNNRFWGTGLIFPSLMPPRRNFSASNKSHYSSYLQNLLCSTHSSDLTYLCNIRCTQTTPSCIYTIASLPSQTYHCLISFHHRTSIQNSGLLTLLSPNLCPNMHIHIVGCDRHFFSIPSLLGPASPITVSSFCLNLLWHCTCITLKWNSVIQSTVVNSKRRTRSLTKVS